MKDLTEILEEDYRNLSSEYSEGIYTDSEISESDLIRLATGE